jgi:hypothetical protein
MQPGCTQGKPLGSVLEREVLAPGFCSHEPGLQVLVGAPAVSWAVWVDGTLCRPGAFQREPYVLDPHPEVHAVSLTVSPGERVPPLSASGPQPGPNALDPQPEQGRLETC